MYKTSKFSEIHKTKSISDLVGNKTHLPQINFDFKQKTSNLKKFEKLKRKNKNFILIAPCANWVGKTWPIDRFSKLIQQLKKEDAYEKYEKNKKLVDFNEIPNNLKDLFYNYIKTLL